MRIKIFCLFVLVIILTNCASIVTGGGWHDVRISSMPPNAKFRIIDERGKQVVIGTTPQTVPLKGGKAYFMQKKYIVQFNLEGYQGANATIGSELNPWYCANAFCGGLFGWILLDPLTGAMYKVDRKEVNVALYPYTPYNQSDTALKSNVVDTKVEVKPLLQDSSALNVIPNGTSKDSISPLKAAPKEFDYYPNPNKRDSL